VYIYITVFTIQIFTALENLFLKLHLDKKYTVLQQNKTINFIKSDESSASNSAIN